MARCSTASRRAARSGRPHHDPVAALGKILVGELIGKLLVVVLVVIPADALLGASRGSTGFEDIEGASLVGIGNKALVFLFAKPFVLEVIELDDVVDPLDFLTGIPLGFFFPVEPERAARFFRKMPVHDLAHPGVESVFRFVRCHDDVSLEKSIPW